MDGMIFIELDTDEATEREVAEVINHILGLTTHNFHVQVNGQ